MKKKTLSPLELKVTYIHSQDNEERKKTWKWLDEILRRREVDKLPYVITVHDPDTNELLVYDGNKRVAHATQNNYNLEVKIISNQGDLNNYLKDESPRWFGIKDFQELLEYMRIYAAYPKEEDEKMPKELHNKVMKKYKEWQQYQQLKQSEMIKKEYEDTGLFSTWGWYNDD